MHSKRSVFSLPINTITYFTAGITRVITDISLYYYTHVRPEEEGKKKPTTKPTTITTRAVTDDAERSRLVVVLDEIMYTSRSVVCGVKIIVEKERKK
jgi:hypothetical protein